MNSLLPELVQIIAFDGIDVYYIMTLTCKRWNTILGNCEDVMDALAKERVIIHRIKQSSRVWEISKIGLHRGYDLPAQIYINTFGDQGYVTYSWYTKGKKHRPSGDANVITLTETDEGIVMIKHWHDSEKTLGRPNGLPSIELYSSTNKLIKREWYDGMHLLREQSEEGTQEYENGIPTIFNPYLTIKNSL